MDIEIDIENLPPIAVQQNIVEEIEQLVSKGKSKAEAIHLVFTYYIMGNKVN